MDLLLHPVAERAVNKLMLLHHIFPPEFSTHNDGAEMMTIIPFYMHQFAWQGTFDVIFNLSFLQSFHHSQFIKPPYRNFLFPHLHGDAIISGYFI